MRALVLVAFCAGMPLLLFGASGPAWWSNPSLVVSGTIPIISGSANDYAAVNEGQVKNFAITAVNEFNTDFASAGGAGPTLTSVAASLSATSVSTNDFAVVNLGQLKALAKPYYDRLFALDYSAGPPLTSGTYPWVGGTASDYAVVNLGQIKNLFSFDPTYSSDGNPLPNWWRLYYFGTLSVSATSTVTISGTTFTYLQVWEHRLAP